MDNDNKKKLIVLTGPTAVGKTDLSIKLAKAIGGEIISADSIQVYKHFDIGSAKITPDEMQGIRHHLIDVLEPTEGFDVATFKKMAEEAMEGIYNRGNIPIVTGGTGFYIQALLYDIDFKETEDDGYRKELEALYNEKGANYMWNMLKDIDPEAAASIHENNVKRVIRAIEYQHQNNRRISEHNQEERAKESPYNFAYIVLNCNRELLYERINKRVDIMMEGGLVDEVKELLHKYNLTSDMTSMQGIGYKEIVPYIKGESSLEDAEYILKRDTRHFAKRQLTWFRREKEVIWINKNEFGYDEEKILQAIVEKWKQRIQTKQ